MKEQHQEQIMQWLQKAVEVGSEQAPLVAEEVLQWAIISGGICATVNAIIVILCAIALSWAWRNQSKADECTVIVTASIAICIAAISAVIMVDGAMLCAKAHFTPRAYLPEYVTKQGDST